MKGVHWLFCLTVMLLGCTGCWPMHATTSPGAHGIICDRETRRPVAGAEVVVSRMWKREWPNYGTPTYDEAIEKTRPPTVETGTNGHFIIPAERKWIAAYPPPEGNNLGTVIVSKTGYRPALIALMGDSAEDVGTVLLTPDRRP